MHGPTIQFPSPIFTLSWSLGKKSCTYLTILNTAGQSPLTSLREKQSLTAQFCLASLAWKINQHSQVYPLLGGKILSPGTSRQSFNNTMKIPDINHIALHYQMNHNSNHATADLIHSLFYMCGFVLYEAKPGPEP